MVMTKIILYSALFILGFVGISLWNFVSVIKPQKIAVNLTPQDFELPSQDVILTAKDGVNLSAWLIPAPQEKQAVKRVIIVLHGYPVEKGDMLSIASSLYPDFSLFLMDLRSFGKSGGEYTTFGIKERDDVSVAVDFLISQGYEKIGIFGFSLGGAIGFIAAAQDERIDAIASYASFADLLKLGEESFSKLWILKKPMVSLMAVWARVLFKESVNNAAPVRAVAKLNIPVFITHSQTDEQISFEHALLLKKALEKNNKAEFYFFVNRFQRTPVSVRRCELWTPVSARELRIRRIAKSKLAELRV